MTGSDRANIRRLQDELIDLAERCGVDDDMRVSINAPSTMTVGALRSFIFPGYEDSIREAIARLTR